MSEAANDIIARFEQSRRGYETARELLSEARNSLLVNLYRAIGEAELQDVLRYGDYDLNPHGGGKYFAIDEAGARRYASTAAERGYPGAHRMTITRIQVPEPFLNLGDVINDPASGGGAGISIHFSDEVLPDLYQHSSPVEILDAPWVPTVSVGDMNITENAVENTTIQGGGLRGADKFLGPAGHLLDAYSLYEAYDADGGFGENFRETAGGITGGAAGGWGGAAAGAALGTAIFPGAGTVVGGIVGGIAGGIGGEKVGEFLGGLF